MPEQEAVPVQEEVSRSGTRFKKWYKKEDKKEDKKNSPVSVT